MSPRHRTETNVSSCSLGINRNVILSITPFSRIVDKRFSSFDTIDSSSFKHKNICKFGDIECETQPLDICVGSHGQSVRKIESKQPNSIDIDDVKLEKRKKMSITDPTTMVTNCVVLHNGSMLFTDFSANSRLILYDANGNILRYI
jgi:hypothetical protein